jgi:ATP-dependent helicase/nuclease subunit A
MMPMLGNKVSLLPYSTRSKADSYMDLILPALIRHPGFRSIVDKYSMDTEDFDRYSDKGTVPPFTVYALCEKDLKDEMVRSAAGGILREEELLKELDESSDNDLYERLMSRFNAKYAHENLKGLFTKTTVSDLKKAELERVMSVSDNEDEDIEESWFEESETVRPKGRLSGAERGTAYHRVMELLDDEIYADEALMRDSLSTLTPNIASRLIANSRLNLATASACSNTDVVPCCVKVFMLCASSDIIMSRPSENTSLASLYSVTALAMNPFYNESDKIQLNVIYMVPNR